MYTYSSSVTYIQRRCYNEGKGNTKGEGKGEGGGEGEFKDRVKGYGNITVAMIMQLSFIRYSAHWFC